MNERVLARSAVAVTIAVGIGTLFWLWAELNWKNVGGRTGIVLVALSGAALALLGAFRIARLPLPIDWIFELVRTTMLVTVVVGAGALVSHLGDFDAGKPLLKNNEPPVAGSVLSELLLVTTAVGISIVVPLWWHRFAAGTRTRGVLSETLYGSGTWLALVVALLAVFGRATHFALARPLVPYAALALVLLAVGALAPPGVDAPRRSARSRAAGAVAGVAGVLALSSGLFGPPLSERTRHDDEASCRSAGAVGLLREVVSIPVTAYRASGLALRRLECRTTSQYADERLVAITGRNDSGVELRGSELFVRVVGTPLERSRAACDILLPGRCDAPLSTPSELVGLNATLPPGESLVPRERDGRLLFLAVTREHPLGRETKLGSRVVLVPHVVELATGRLDVR